MSRGRRFSPGELAAVFKRYKAGEPLTDIAVSLKRSPGAVHNVLHSFGGFAPRERKRGSRALSLAER